MYIDYCQLSYPCDLTQYVSCNKLTVPYSLHHVLHPFFLICWCFIIEKKVFLHSYTNRFISFLNTNRIILLNQDRLFSFFKAPKLSPSPLTMFVNIIRAESLKLQWLLSSGSTADWRLPIFVKASSTINIKIDRTSCCKCMPSVKIQLWFHGSSKRWAP